jgi:hypothetical protein
MNEYTGGFIKRFEYKNIPLYLYLVSALSFFITFIIISINKKTLPSYLILSVSVVILLCFASNIQFMATSSHPSIVFLSWILVIGFIILNSYGLYKLNEEKSPDEEKK